MLIFNNRLSKTSFLTFIKNINHNPSSFRKFSTLNNLTFNSADENNNTNNLLEKQEYTEALQHFYNTPNLKDASHLISNNQIPLEEVTKIYESIKNQEPKNCNLFLALINRYKEENDKKKENQIFNEMKQLVNNMSIEDLGKIDDNPWNTIICEFCKHDSLLDCLSLIDKVPSKKVNKTSLNIILNNCVENKLTDKALEIFNSMEQRFNIIPDVKHYTCILKGLFNEKRPEEARNFYKRMKNEGILPNDITILTLIHGYLENNLNDRAIQLFKVMEKKFNVSPTAREYSIIIRACVLDGGLDEGFVLFQQMESRNIRPEAVTLHFLIDCFSKVGNVDVALELLDKMKNKFHYKPLLATYNSVMQGLTQTKRLDDAKKFLSVMEQDGVNPDELTLHLMLNLYVEHKRDKDANYLFRLMVQKYHVQPTIYHYNTLIKCLIKKGSIEDVIKLFEVMESTGVSPDSVTLSTILDFYATRGDLKQTMVVLKNMQQKYKITPQIQHFNSLFKVLIRQGRFRDALNLLAKIEGDGIKPIDHTFTILLNGCRNSDDLGTGRLIHQRLEKEGLLNDKLISALMKMYFDCGSREEAKALLYKYEDREEVVKSYEHIAGEVDEL
ncbi:hypothetical protein ABK040_009234 [Willaertia magna]